MFIATLLIDIQICKHPKGPSAVNAQKVGQAPKEQYFGISRNEHSSHKRYGGSSLQYMQIPSNYLYGIQ